MKDALTVEQQRALMLRECQRMLEPGYRETLESPSPDMIPTRRRLSLQVIWSRLRSRRVLT